MKTRDRNSTTLDHLIEEARGEATPTVHWSEVEEALLKRVAETPRAHARRNATPLPLLAAAAAVLAIGGLIVVRGGTGLHVGGQPASLAGHEAPMIRHSLNGDELAPGAVVTSGAEALVVEHRGHVVWTLSPQSSAHVESVGDIVALALDRGEISAEVTKSPKPESFVVRVEHTRVAVHGTRFRVARLADSVRVDVQEGVVGVGPLDRPGFELRAPDGATVSFDGIRTDVAGSSGPERGRIAATPSTRGPQHAATPKSAYFAPVGPDGLPRGALAGVEQVIASVERCLREYTVSGDDLRVSVETSLTLRVDPKGAVGEAVFAPPLAPNVGACVDDAVGAISFPRSEGGFVAYRVLELNR